MTFPEALIPVTQVKSAQKRARTPVDAFSDASGGAFDYGAVLAACARGDKAALQALYALEAGRMTGVAQRIVRRREVAEDVVQDAFVQIWRKAATFDPTIGAPRAWIYQIVRNRALNVIRDGGREDLADDATLDALRDVPVSHDDLVERLPDRHALRRCLDGLDATRRRSILLAYVGGLTHGEIAGHLGVPLGTVKAWIRRSLIALKECLA